MLERDGRLVLAQGLRIALLEGVRREADILAGECASGVGLKSGGVDVLEAGVVGSVVPGRRL